MPIPRTLNRNFFKAWTPEMAYVTGFFAADGSMIKNRRGGCYIEFTSADRILLQKLRVVLGSNHKISARKQKVGKRYYRIQIGSARWFEDLARLGFSSSKSWIIRFLYIPKKYLKDFVRGYFDGDGCVYFKKLKYADRKYKRWVLLTLFTSGSERFLAELHKELRICGVKGGSLKNKTRGFELALSHKDSLALYQLIYQNMNTTDLYLPRKHKLFTKGIKTLYPNAAVV